ncbi:MAG: hypothetical protein V3T84_17060 [Phycisphaerales bacterium]
MKKPKALAGHVIQSIVNTVTKALGRRVLLDHCRIRTPSGSSAAAHPCYAGACQDHHHFFATPGPICGD